MSNKDENTYPRDVQIKRILAWIGLIGGILILFVMRGTQRPIPELSEQAQSLSDSYVDQLNQEISIARQQGFLAQQQAKVEFLTSVVEQGNELLEDEAIPDEKIFIGGANYFREEVETDLQSRQERLETSAAQIDSTQRAIGRMQDALSNLKDLTQFDVNSISEEEALQAQLVALHSIGQLPWPTLSKSASVEGAVKKARVDFDHRLGLLGQSSSPDLGDLFAFLEESSVSNFHWREELGLNKSKEEYPGVTLDEEDLVAYLTRSAAGNSRGAQAITEAPQYEPAKWYIPNNEDLDKETRFAVAGGSLIVWAVDLQPGQMSEAHRFSTRKLGVTGYHMERSKGLPLFITINGETDFLPSGEDPELPTIYNVGDFQVSVPDSAEFGGNVRLLLHTN